MAPLFSSPLTIVSCFWNGANGLRIGVSSKFAPFGHRRPLLHDRAVRQIHEPHVRLRAGRGLGQRRPCRDHRVEQRQAHGDAGAAEERASREMLLGDEHYWLLDFELRAWASSSLQRTRLEAGSSELDAFLI